jgi:hypothetical protein
MGESVTTHAMNLYFTLHEGESSASIPGLLTSDENVYVTH